MSIAIRIIFFMLLYTAFFVFVLSMCAASKTGMDEKAENDLQYQWLVEHQRKKPTAEKLWGHLPFGERIQKRLYHRHK